MSTVAIEKQVQSYRYLRIVMVGLLLALAAAVFYQRIQQGSFLGSVSGYYYTPAQAVFVGALIGLGVSMIALRGMNEAEDAFLNLGGIFAIVVAIVPTGRGSDYQAAVQACQKSGVPLLTQRASNPDCPTVRALENAARANVANNMAALLITGGLTLVLAGVILFKGRTTKSGSQGRRWVLAEFSVAALLWLGALIALTASVDWIRGNAHYIAAGSLAICILLVAGANAHRRKEKPSNGVVPKADVLKSPQAYPYTWTAVTMLIAAVVVIVLWQTNVISLFWVEIAVGLLFVLFWTAQTIEVERARATAARSPSGTGTTGPLSAGDAEELAHGAYAEVGPGPDMDKADDLADELAADGPVPPRAAEAEPEADLGNPPRL
jgi:hypothetical protein